MSLPKVSIVGRPNVGKSSIFNWLAGRRLAIVDNMAGVTRDRMTYLLQEEDRYLEIIDTGGIGINDVDDLDEEIERQIQLGISGADLLMFVVDARDGKTVLDQHVAERLRAIDKRYYWCPTNVTAKTGNWTQAIFTRWVLGSPFCVVQRTIAASQN